MIEFDEYKVKLNNIHPKLKELASSLNIEECKVDLDRLHAQIESDGFWDNRRSRGRPVSWRPRSSVMRRCVPIGTI